MVYFVAITYLMVHMLIAITLKLMEIHMDKAEIPVYGMLSKMCSTPFIYVLLLSPSIWHLALIYVPGFLLSITYFIHKHAEFEDLFIIIALYMIIIIVVFWYIF